MWQWPFFKALRLRKRSESLAANSLALTITRLSQLWHTALTSLAHGSHVSITRLSQLWHTALTSLAHGSHVSSTWLS